MSPDPEDAVGDLLNEAQRCSLSVRLRAFEMHLREADSLLQVREDRGILCRRYLELTSEQRDEAHRLIVACLAQVELLAARFALPVTTDDLGAMVAAQFGVDWASLVDSRSGRLSRYGDVDPRLADVLDADLETLAASALVLAEVFRRRARS